jgi:hypothetical protein
VVVIKHCSRGTRKNPSIAKHYGKRMEEKRTKTLVSNADLK